MLLLLSQIIFFGLLLVLAVFSLAMIYVLLRFSKSKTFGLGLIVLYFILMLSLYATAQNQFNNLPFI